MTAIPDQELSLKKPGIAGNDLLAGDTYLGMTAKIAIPCQNWSMNRLGNAGNGAKEAAQEEEARNNPEEAGYSLEERTLYN